MDEDTRVFVKKQIIGFVITVLCVTAIQVIVALRDEDSTARFRIKWEADRLRRKLGQDGDIRREAEEGIAKTESYLQRIEKRRGHDRSH